MKAVLKFTYLSIIVITGLASCKKETGDPPPDPITPATELVQYKNNNEYVKFDYNPDNSIGKVIVKNEVFTGNEEVTYAVEYAGNNISALATAAGQKIVPVYENNFIKRADMFENGERISYTSYYYENGLLKNAVMYYNNENTYYLFFEYVFEYDNAGNIGETIALVATDVPDQLVRAGSATLQYDNHLNPLYKHKDLLALFWQAVSKNNILKENHFDADLQPEETYNYTYNYLNNGLPKNAEVKQQAPDGPVSTFNIEFIYK